MPLFPPPLPTQQILSLPGIENISTTGAVTAGSAFFVAVYNYAQITATQMRCQFSGSPTGSVSMGIYDATGTNGGPGNLLGNTAANTAATGVFTKNLTANLLLPPGAYWLAFLDTVGDTIFARFPTAGMAAGYKTSATNLTVLPATSGAIVDAAIIPAIMALLSNSFS